ncbi:hypothetical protein [Anaerosolibacter sp.]|uniref:hypothetical protein n=1 Tax=Anaerosolibacter sp. TaxID=1872527 RepID=UPI0039F0CB3D
MLHEIPYDHDLAMSEIECEIWHIATEQNITWDEALRIWRGINKESPSSDHESDSAIPF